MRAALIFMDTDDDRPASRRGARLATIILIALLAVMLYQLLLGHGSVIRVHRMQAQLQGQLIKNKAAKIRNELLSAELDELKEGLAGVEEHARRSLGMIKPNEIFVNIVPATPATK